MDTLPTDLQGRILDMAYTESDVVPIMAERVTQLNNEQARRNYYEHEINTYQGFIDGVEPQSVMDLQQEYYHNGQWHTIHAHSNLVEGSRQYVDHFTGLRNASDARMTAIRESTEQDRQRFFLFNMALRRFRLTGHF